MLGPSLLFGKKSSTCLDKLIQIKPLYQSCIFICLYSLLNISYPFRENSCKAGHFFIDSLFYDFASSLALSAHVHHGGQCSLKLYILPGL